MKVHVNATSVGQMLNADVINVDNLSHLSAEQRSSLVAELAGKLKASAGEIGAGPAIVESETAERVARATRAVAAELLESAPEREKKETVVRYLAQLRASLGDVADVVLNAVKLAHIFGIGQ